MLMTKYNIWPIFTDENSTLFIKQRSRWLMYSSNNTLIYIILMIIILIIIMINIFWYISKNIEIYPYMDISLLDSINTRYIYIYSLTINERLLTLKSFWNNYNFLHFYLNLFLKDPINIIRGYFHLFIYFNSSVFDNSLLNFGLDLDFLKNSHYYWSFILGKTWSLYYIKELFALPAWPRLPRFWWYWTDNFYVLNYHSKLLKWFPKEDHYMILIMEALRPYIYSLFIYFSYLYWYNYNDYFLNLTNSQVFTEWGFFWSSYQLGKLTKWFHLNRNALIIFTQPPSIPKLPYIEFIDSLDPELYTIQAGLTFFPRVATFFINKLYLPIYLPVESFNFWFHTKYNGFLWLFSSSFNFHLHYLTLQEFSTLTYVIKEYMKNYYVFVQINYLFEYYSSIYYNSVTYLKYFYFSYIEELFNWEFFTRKVNWEIYRLKRMQKINYYGVWSFKNLKHICLFIIPYFWVLWALFSHWKSYFYRDFWLFSIVWYNPTYLWNLFEVNQDIEHDYMLSSEYFKKSRIKNYADMYYGIIQVFYWVLGFYLMNYILINLEPSVGIAYYFVYPWVNPSNTLLYSWIIYVLVPFVIIRLYDFLYTLFYRLKNSTQLWLSKLAKILLFIILLFSISEKKQNFYFENIKYFDIKKYLVLNDRFNTNLKSEININKYWLYDQQNFFDLININFYMYNNNNFKYIALNKFRKQLVDNSTLHMKFYNLSWLMIQSNHFYQYYDYIDSSQYSIKKLSDF